MRNAKTKDVTLNSVTEGRSYDVMLSEASTESNEMRRLPAREAVPKAGVSRPIKKNLSSHQIL